MVTGAYDAPRGRWSDRAHGFELPEIDPTDDSGADVRQVSQPERRLLFAILTDALVRFRRLANAPRSVHANRELVEAERWIRSDDREWPFSYVNVCEALDIAPEPLRKAVLAWRRPEVALRRVTRRGLLVKKKRRLTTTAEAAPAASEKTACDAAVASLPVARTA
jgi:hypothetical protein